MKKEHKEFYEAIQNEIYKEVQRSIGNFADISELYMNKEPNKNKSNVFCNSLLGFFECMTLNIGMTLSSSEGMSVETAKERIDTAYRHGLSAMNNKNLIKKRIK